MSVALVLGVARAVNILLENGYISDTILNYFSGVVTGMSPMPFILVMLVVYIILGFFINSSSGLAVLSILFMAPLGDAVGISESGHHRGIQLRPGPHQLHHPDWPDLGVARHGRRAVQPLAQVHQPPARRNDRAERSAARRTGGDWVDRKDVGLQES